MNLFSLIDKLESTRSLAKNDYIMLLNHISEPLSQYLFAKSRKAADKYFGNRIYVRGLIEFTNYCINNCYYCGIRRGNTKADRYRLTREEILKCCNSGYDLGFRTFVLQGGEDNNYTDCMLLSIITDIKHRYPECALTLSIGERSNSSYKAFFDAGVDRFLLRHETADEEHYAKLHPPSQALKKRKDCLYALKEIGYQVGTGFMVGSPYQTVDNLADDLLFVKELSPAMIGMGPFVPHHDTPFADKEQGSLRLTLFLIGLLRLMIPNALIPATTALGTIDPEGREKGILAGANVLMPNLSPMGVRNKYLLYDNKISTGEEAAEGLSCLQKRLKRIGYEIVVDRGDFKEGNINV